MGVREFRLVNEKGQSYSLMDLENYCFLSDPSGLGYSYVTEYQQLNYTFLTNLRKIAQGIITGIANFKSYDSYRAMTDFIENAETLRFAYKIPYKSGTKEFFKDVQIMDFSKTQIQPNGILSETITFDCLTLWYEENTVTYTVEPIEDEIRWDFRWDSRFFDYSSRNLQYINNGQIEAPIRVEIDGYIVNPQIDLYVEGVLYKSVKINITINQYEKLIYDSRENNFTIAKQNTDGTLTDLFSLDYIDPENDNLIVIPKGKSCEIVLTADGEVVSAKLTIYPQYKAV